VGRGLRAAVVRLCSVACMPSTVGADW
jgi:hypothetical protein